MVTGEQTQMCNERQCNACKKTDLMTDDWVDAPPPFEDGGAEVADADIVVCRRASVEGTAVLPSASEGHGVQAAESCTSGSDAHVHARARKHEAARIPRSADGRAKIQSE